MSTVAAIGARAAALEVAKPASPLLCCPACRGWLLECAERLRCSRCERSWAVEAGVPQFGGVDLRPHRLSTAQRTSIAQCAEASGWETAMHDKLRRLDEHVYRQAIDEYHAQWRLLLPLSETSRVLSLNCGWGALALNLAESCASVVAADACPMQASFLAARARQSGHYHLLPVQVGMEQRLPFVAHQFDAVTLIGGLSDFSRDRQRMVLEQIRQVLRPGGSLLLAEANALNPVRVVQSTANHPQTMYGYRRALQAAGFDRIKTYVPAPSHHEPFFLLALDDPAPLAYALRTIFTGHNLETHFKQRGLGGVYRLARVLTKALPGSLLARAARSFVPSIAFLASV